jgi:tetratricopeptide (TPR) repeat protein
VEKTVGAENPDTARARGNLASVLLDLGRLDEAKAEFASALALWEKTYGPDHPMIAMAATGLGTIHVKLGDPATGLTFCERAIKIGMATLPEAHPVRAHHQICAANALTELHRYGEAVEHYERTLAIRTAAGVDVAGQARAGRRAPEARRQMTTAPTRDSRTGRRA